MSMEPKVKSVRLAVDSVRANQTLTDSTVINAPPDITTSLIANHAIVTELVPREGHVRSRPVSAVVDQTLEVVIVANVHRAFTIIQLASSVTATRTAALLMYVILNKEHVLVNQTSVDHAVTDVRRDSTDTPNAFLAAAVRQDCRSMTAIVTDSVYVNQTSPVEHVISVHPDTTIIPNVNRATVMPMVPMGYHATRRLANVTASQPSKDLLVTSVDPTTTTIQIAKSAVAIQLVPKKFLATLWEDVVPTAVVSYASARNA